MPQIPPHTHRYIRGIIRHATREITKTYLTDEDHFVEESDAV
jgi:hypothetical protein